MEIGRNEYPISITDYHAKYFVHEVTKRCPSDSIQKLMISLADAQVDLNPHPGTFQNKKEGGMKSLFKNCGGFINGQIKNIIRC